MYKGHLKLLVLKILSKGPKNGYQMMSALAEDIGKRPSSGSIYPLLETMRKEGLVSVKTVKRSKIYSLTTQGKNATKAHSKDDECNAKFSQMLKMFQSMMNSKELAMAKDGFEMLLSDKKKALTFKKEMLPLKMELIRILKEYDESNIKKAKIVLSECVEKLKKLN